jgi:FMN phosphatase YigB (HAD superfamily)
VKNSPKTVAIAWDLHNVLFRPAYGSLSRCFFTAVRHPSLWKLGINPYFWYKIYTLKKETKVVEAVYKNLCREFPSLNNHIALFIQACNAQKPQLNVLNLVKQLKVLGYPQYIVSNIGEETFEHLSKQYPHIMQLFDGALVSREADNYPHKPQAVFYELFKQKVGSEYATVTTWVLIDDSISKLKGAQMSGFLTIHFRQVDSLKHELQELLLL